MYPSITEGLVLCASLTPPANSSHLSLILSWLLVSSSAFSYKHLGPFCTLNQIQSASLNQLTAALDTIDRHKVHIVSAGFHRTRLQLVSVARGPVWRPKSHTFSCLWVYTAAALAKYFLFHAARIQLGHHNIMHKKRCSTSLNACLSSFSATCVICQWAAGPEWDGLSAREFPLP